MDTRSGSRRRWTGLLLGSLAMAGIIVGPLSPSAAIGPPAPVAATAAAAIGPELMNFQGDLRDGANKPLSGAYDLVFRFFDAPAGGTLLLADTHSAPGGAVSVTEGIFDTVLGGGQVTPGSQSTLGALFANAPAVWLEIQVGGETLNPRMQVTSAAYAQNARTLDGVEAGGFALAGQEVVDAADATLMRSGAGTAADPYKLSMNLGNANTWTDQQTFGPIQVTGTVKDASGSAGISGQVLKSTGLGTQWGDASGTTDTDWTIAGNNMYSGVSGNLGIGTTAPDEKLSVVGTGLFDGDDIGVDGRAVGNRPGGYNTGIRAAAMNSPAGNTGISGYGDSTDSPADSATFGGTFKAFGPSAGGTFAAIGTDSESFSMANAKAIGADTFAQSESGPAIGVQGVATSSSGKAYGVYGRAMVESGTEPVYSVFGDTAYGSTTGAKYAGYFNGDVRIIGALKDSSGGAGTSGQVLKSTGTGTLWGDASGTTDTDWTITGDNMVSGVPGNVGIGTTAPTEKLHVAGTGLFDGDGLGVEARATGNRAGQPNVGIRVDAYNSPKENLGVYLVADSTNSPANTETYGGYFKANGSLAGGTTPTYGISSQVVSKGATKAIGLDTWTRSEAGSVYGVQALAESSAGTAYGVYGYAAVASGTGPVYSIYGDRPYGSTTGAKYAGYFDGNVGITGALKDSLGVAGTSGQVLQSTGTGIQWGDASGTPDTDWTISGSNMYSGVSGNVGIGITSPAYKLDVSGPVRADRYRGINSLILNDYRTVNPASNVLLYSSPNDRDSWVLLDSEDTASNWGIYHRQIDSTVGNLPANSIGFIGGGDSSVKSFIELNTGNAYFKNSVGIGTTAPKTSLHLPQQGLQIGTSTTASDNFCLVSDLGTSGTTRAFRLRNGDYGTATSLLTALPNGKVGIGTETPNATLDVNGAVRTNKKDILLREGTDTNHGLGYYSGDTSKPFGTFKPDGPVLYGWGGGGLGTTEDDWKVVLAWNSSGYVGINQPNPTANLDVAGTVQMFGTWTARNVSQNYTAETDGFVVAKISTTTNGDRGYITGSTPVGASRMAASVHDYTGSDTRVPYNSFSMPVRKGDTYRIDFSAMYGSPTATAYWIPLGHAQHAFAGESNPVATAVARVSVAKAPGSGKAAVHGADNPVVTDGKDLLPTSSTVAPAERSLMLPVCEEVSAGEVLVADTAHPGLYCLGRLTADRRVVGIAAAASQPDNEVKAELGDAFGLVTVATQGIVPCKVDAAYGPIETGDLLVSAPTPGHAMRAQPTLVNGMPLYESGTLIGKALDPLETGTGIIRVLVMLQ